MTGVTGGVWFGARTAFSYRVMGNTDAPFVFEQRVVVFRAPTFEDAMAIAEKEADSYARRMSARNSDGQEVRVEYLGYCNVFEIGDTLEDGVEVHSQLTVHPTRASQDELLDRFVGTENENDSSGISEFFE